MTATTTTMTGEPHLVAQPVHGDGACLFRAAALAENQLVDPNDEPR